MAPMTGVVVNADGERATGVVLSGIGGGVAEPMVATTTGVVMETDVVDVGGVTARGVSTGVAMSNLLKSTNGLSTR